MHAPREGELHHKRKWKDQWGERTKLKNKMRKKMRTKTVKVAMKANAQALVGNKAKMSNQ